MDVLETTKGKLRIEFELPGVAMENIKVNMTPDSIEVFTSKPKRENAIQYYITERHFGNYHRRLELPFRVDTTKANAVFDTGVLKVYLIIISYPNRNRTSPR